MAFVVYGPHYSTYVRTTRLALEEEGLSYDLVEVDILKGEQQGAGASGTRSVRSGAIVRARRVRPVRDRCHRPLHRGQHPARSRD